MIDQRAQQNPALGVCYFQILMMRCRFRHNIFLQLPPGRKLLGNTANLRSKVLSALPANHNSNPWLPAESGDAVEQYGFPQSVGQIDRSSEMQSGQVIISLPCCREFNSQGDTVQLPANLHDSRGILVRHNKRRLHGDRPFNV